MVAAAFRIAWAESHSARVSGLGDASVARLGRSITLSWPLDGQDPLAGELFAAVPAG